MKTQHHIAAERRRQNEKAVLEMTKLREQRQREDRARLDALRLDALAAAPPALSAAAARNRMVQQGRG